MPLSALRPQEPSPVESLLEKTSHSPGAPSYGGDIAPREAYEYMLQNPSLLVDVRTLPEWQFVGVPDLGATQAQFLTLSWKLYPGFTLNVDFASEMQAQTKGDKELVIFFLCRSGGRSLDAACAMAAQGYRYCFNIAGGFEGEPDGNSQRGRQSGWKAAQLPWKQG